MDRLGKLSNTSEENNINKIPTGWTYEDHVLFKRNFDQTHRIPPQRGQSLGLVVLEAETLTALRWDAVGLIEISFEQNMVLMGPPSWDFIDIVLL